MAGPLDQRIQIVADVVNQDKVAALTAEIAKQKEEISKWNAQVKAGVMTQANFNVNAMQAASVIKGATQDLKALNIASGTAGRGLGQLSYAIDDLQYGFNAIVNNIPQIVMGLGGGVGLAGAVGIAAVAINQLIKHWGDLTAAFQSAWSGQTVEGLKAIAETAEAAAKAFDKLLAAKTAAQGAEAAGVAKAITESPTQRIQAALLVAIQGDPLAAKRMVAEKGGFQTLGPGAIPNQPKTQADLDREADIKDQATVNRLMGEATLAGPMGEQARNQLKRLAAKNPDSFPQGFGSDLDAASPEGQKRQRAFLLETDAKKKVAADIEKNRKEHADKAENQAKVEGRVAMDNAEAAKKKRIEALQDQEKMIQKEKHEIGEGLWQAMHRSRPGEILQGAKAAIDKYQMGGSDAKRLQEKAHKLQEEANKKLEKIREAIDKERRLVLQH